MADEWFCEIAGREIGPLSAQQLRAMAAKGQILPGDRVRQGQQGAWAAAEQVRGLFPPPVEPARPSPPTSPQPRQSDLPVARSAPQPPPTPRTAAPASLPRAEAFEPPPEADNPVSINIVADPSLPTGAVRVGRRIILPRAKRQLQQQKMMVVLLLVAIVGLAVAALILVVGGGPAASGKIEGGGGLTKLARLAAERTEDSKTIADSSEVTEEPKKVDSFDAPTTRPKITADLFAEPGERTEKKPAADQRETKAPEWVDASAGPARVAEVAFKLAEIVLVSPSGGPAIENTPVGARLLIVVEVENTSANRKLDFVGWTRGGVARGVRLTDNFDNAYRARPVGRSGAPGEETKSLYPGRSRRETLVFEPPIPKTEFLRLELPASAVGESGTARLKIPTSMIVYRAEEADDFERPPPPERQPREYPPGTPQGDFGLPGVDEGF